MTVIAKPFSPLELAGQVAEALGWSWENKTEPLRMG